MGSLLKKFSMLVFMLFAVTGPATAETVQLQQLLEEADRNNPSLKAALEQIAVADAKIPQVTSLRDPELSISLSSYPTDNLKGDATPMTGNEIRLGQMFPFPGKLDAKGKIAAKQSDWFAAAYQDSRLQLRQQVKDAWYLLLFQQQALELTNRNLQLLDDFIKLTEVRYEVGKGLQQNVLKAHLQRSKQLESLLSLQQQLQATQAELNSLAGRETDQPLEVVEQLDSFSVAYNLELLQQQAVENRPLFAAYDALIDQYKSQRTLAALDYRPDFNLWGSYRFRDDGLADGGTDFISAGISFNLPLANTRRSAAVAEADSALRLAYQQRNDFRNKLNLAIHRSLTRLEQAAQLVDLYKGGIIPQANQTFQSTLSAYQVDKVDFLDLLDAVMSLYRYEIDYARVLSDQQRSRAQLEAAAGLDAGQLKSLPQSDEG